MSDWKPIDTAPMGTTVQVKRGKGMEDRFMPEWVLVWRCDDGMVRMTYCLQNGRWNGYTNEFPPTHWHPIPTPPKG